MAVQFNICKNYMQIAVSVYFLVTNIALAIDVPGGRKPANFVPDDDMIVVPIVIEKSFIDKFNEKHANEFRGSRDKLRYWIAQEEYADAYGLEGRGIVNTPSEAEKQKFLDRNILRFISKDIEKSTNGGVKDIWDNWTADDEIDAIESIENHERVLVHAEGKKPLQSLEASKTVKVGKSSKVKIGFQPRIEIGMVKFTLKSKLINARAWVGINGNQELNLERKFKSTGTKAFINYKIDETRLLMAVDQRLSTHWGLRFTHQKDVEGFSEMTKTGISENNIVQLRFSKRF